MTAGTRVGPTETGRGDTNAGAVVLRAAFALAAAMGVGRFVYTPILPLMQEQAGMSAQVGGHLATANYLGYLLGAVTASLVPGLARSSRVLRTCLVLLVATLAAMPISTNVALWLGLRCLAGVASALIFVVASNATLSRLRGRSRRRAGWVYSGVGAGIVLSGLSVLAVRGSGSWSQAWWLAAALAAALAVGAWQLPDTPAPAQAGGRGEGAERRRPWFVALLVSYTAEGAGYIIAGTFLVAALEHTGPSWLGSGAWVVVGLAAVPSCAAWAAASRRWSHPALLVAALVIQAIGIALPALVGGVVVAVVSAVLFGATFMGVTTVSLSAGAHLGIARAAALLTAGYSLGQVLGPVGVTPLLGQGYAPALLVAAALVLLGALAAALLRIGYPHPAR